MNPSQIVRLVICVALMVAPLHAKDEVCAFYANTAFNVAIRDWTEIGEKCGNSYGFFIDDYYRPPTKALCAKPGCVDEIKKASNVVPDCIDDMSDLSLRTLVLAAAKMCENEARDGNLPTAGSGSLDNTAGSLGSNDTITVDDYPICSDEESSKISELTGTKEYKKACGEPSRRWLQEACFRPECMAYYKDTIIPNSPDCRFKTDAKFTVARCDAIRETAPSASVTTIPGMMVLIVVAFAALILA